MNRKTAISTIATLAILLFIPTSKTHACSCRPISPCAYRIEALARTGDPNVYSTKNEVYSKPLRLTLDDDVVELTLTLSQPGARSRCDEEKKRQNRN